MTDTSREGDVDSHALAAPVAGGRFPHSVWPLSAALAALAFVVSTGPLRGDEGLAAPLELPWWALALMFCLGDGLMVHLHFRRDAHSFTLSEIPLVLGLFTTSPTTVVLARLLGSSIALSLIRRQRPVKLAFNLSLFAVEAACAAFVFHTVGGGNPLLPRSTGAAFAAMLATTLVGIGFVYLAVSLSGGRPQLRTLTESLGIGSAITITNTSVALLGAALLWSAPALAALTLVPAAVLLIAYRAYLRERSKRRSLGFLYETTRTMHGAKDLEAAMTALLAQARTMFRADFAEIVLLPARASEAFRAALGPGDSVEEPRAVDRDSAERTSLSAVGDGQARLLARPGRGPNLGFRRSPSTSGGAMIAPLRADDRIVGTLTVADRLGDVDNFHDDFQLFETLASHVGVSLELIELEEELRRQALYDSLTGLPNRALFRDRVEHALALERPNGESPAVLFLDLDDFKTINDSLGHGAGDRVLIAVGERLRSCVRVVDTAARLGGDEFAVLVEDVRDASEAVPLAKAIIETIAAPLAVEGKDVAVSASVGIAVASSSGKSAGEILRNADAAMYKAKQFGKDSYEIFEPGLHAAALRRLELTGALQSAVEEQQFAVFYQPLVWLEDGATSGVEALVRWRHPQLGLVPPGEFLDLAEETGLIVPIGRFVLREACRQGRAWLDAHPDTPLEISVNMSPRQLQDPGVVRDVADALRDSGLEPQRLILEITETVLVRDPAGAIEKLSCLKSLGVRLAIDDFGTGYASLSYLAEFPVDVLKIPKPFVDRLDSGEPALVQAIIGIGEALGLGTVAEGIESAKQADRLRRLGCKLGQGYFFGKPMAVDEPDLARRVAGPPLPAGESGRGRVIRFRSASQ